LLRCDQLFKRGDFLLLLLNGFDHRSGQFGIAKPINMVFILAAFEQRQTLSGFGTLDQFALGGAGNMRRIHEQAATSAGLTNTLSANGALALPFDFALVSRMGRTNSRSWSRRTADKQDVVDGVQLDLPDLTLRWSFVPGASPLGKLASNLEPAK